MNTNFLSKSVFGILFGACLLHFQVQSAEKIQAKPNIIFFLVDDMGWQETSVPFWSEKTTLNNRYFTPNMESLAEKGMKFTQAYACPLCSPTLYNIPDDISEASNLATENPEKTREMAAELGKYLREVNAERPSFKESGKYCLWPDESPQIQN